ncbi:MAG TPA: GDSL-type esterase/lipase family protein [Ideonella sp.]|uniref:GDSL-type esterase/lipase family protein n=1 Tax=Ideonella sp. TaxID=1929293 RepID=UPI002E300C00|nr:GDSL-type esterase/lipase family protein [Ideonella sp.]HEX5686135.1 GDSL-type esterase/lipase family protein [Ideonella sp.]
MKTILRSLLLGTSLVAGMSGALAQTGADFVVLPAPAAAWRTVVGSWGNQAELTGDSVLAPGPNHVGAIAWGNGSRREAVQLDWKDLWATMLRFESREPLDLRPYLGGTLEFDLDVTELAKGGVRAVVGCGEWCERSVNLIEPARAWAGKGRQHVALAMSCFVREGADFSKVRLPFALEGAGSGRVSVANVRITREAKAGLPCPDHRTESFTPAPQTESFSIDWWLPLHTQKLQEKNRLVAAGTPPEVVFIGDSITQGWENEGRAVWQRHFARQALALGFGGDRTENVLWRLQNGEVDGITPKVAVLMIGTNNAGMRTPESTAAGVKHLLRELRQRLPSTQVLLLAIFPRGEKPDDHLRGVNDRVNKLIAGYADGRSVHYLDISAALLNPDGSLSKDVMPDLLHLSEKGYAIWQRAMVPTLQRLLAERP